MFVELMPLLTRRTVMTTVAREDQNTRNQNGSQKFGTRTQEKGGESSVDAERIAF